MWNETNRQIFKELTYWFACTCLLADKYQPPPPDKCPQSWKKCQTNDDNVRLRDKLKKKKKHSFTNSELKIRREVIEKDRLSQALVFANFSFIGRVLCWTRCDSRSDTRLAWHKRVVWGELELIIPEESALYKFRTSNTRERTFHGKLN